MKNIPGWLAGMVLAAILAMLGSLPGHAADPVVVGDPWIRGTVAAQRATGAYMVIQATEPVALVGVRSPVAARAEFHVTVLERGIMKMRPVEKIDLAAGMQISLTPGGHHVMLMDLNRALTDGENVPLTLMLQRPDGSKISVEVRATVRPLSGAQGHKSH